MSRFILTKAGTLSFLLASLAAPSIGYSWNDINGALDVSCQQSTSETNIECQYRSLTNNRPDAISAKLGNQSLPISNERSFPWMNSSTSILFMVDTSDPARQAVVEKNLQQIRQMTTNLKPHQRVGLATFDKNLRLHAEPGASRQSLLDSMSDIKAVGKTTELYRNIIGAIKILAKSGSDRKTILIFSDGLAEDKAYFHQDVIKLARENQVIITSLGFPRSTAQSVALQRLRRLSEETGGLFIESNSNYEINSTFLSQPFNSVDNGGTFNINLADVVLDKLQTGDKLYLQFTTAGERTSFNLPIDIPVMTTTDTSAVVVPVTPEPIGKTIKPVVQQAVTPATTANTAPIKVISTESNVKPVERWLLYSLPIALIILLLLTVATFLMTIWKPKSKKYPVIETGDLKPYAYLVIQDSTQRRYPITRTSWRIGRSKDNELSYHDNSISRRHCEIHREHGDVFTLLDLNSLNGVFVNNEKVKIHQLTEGDIIEVGDINFRFTLLSSEHSLEEATSVQKTKVPLTQH